MLAWLTRKPVRRHARTRHVIVAPGVSRGLVHVDVETAKLLRACQGASLEFRRTVGVLQRRTGCSAAAACRTLRRLHRLGALAVSSVPLQLHEHRGVHLLVRRGRQGRSDRAIARTVQHEYFLDQLELPRAKTLVDVGAHIGSFSAFLKQRQPALRVLAVEAHPRNAQLARLNLAAWSDTDVCYGACGYTPGDFVFLIAPLNTGGHTLAHRAAAAATVARSRGALALEDCAPGLVTLEQLAARHGLEEISILKLDCEGFELDIFSHATSAMLERVGRIVGERHCGRAEFLDRCGRRLREAHFEMVADRELGPGQGLFLAVNRRFR